MVCKEFERLSVNEKVNALLNGRIIAVSEDILGSLHLVDDFYVEVIIDPWNYQIESVKTYRSHEVPGPYLHGIILPGGL